jgi:hypothetical protein
LRVEFAYWAIIFTAFVLHGLDLKSGPLWGLIIAILRVLNDIGEKGIRHIFNKVFFIRNQYDLHVVVRVCANLLQPSWQVEETLEIGHVVEQKGTDGEPVVSGGDTQELLGSRGIPDLGSDPLVRIWEGHRLELEFYPICCLWLLLEITLGHPEEKI